MWGKVCMGGGRKASPKGVSRARLVALRMMRVYARQKHQLGALIIHGVP